MTYKKSVAYVRHRFQAKLDPARKENGRLLLIQHMEAHPLAEERAVSWESSFLGYLQSHRLMLSGTLASFALFFSTMGMAGAEEALPGDKLYGIKVHVNEELRNDINLSPALSALWQVERVHRRLEEARVLEERGELTESNRLTIETLASEHVGEISRLATYYQNTHQEDRVAAIRAALDQVLAEAPGFQVNISGSRVALRVAVPVENMAEKPETPEVPKNTLKPVSHSQVLPKTSENVSGASAIRKGEGLSGKKESAVTEKNKPTPEDVEKKLEAVKSLLPAL